MAAALDDDERVARKILGRDEPWRVAAAAQAADTETASLAQRVALEAVVPADDRTVIGLDRSRPPRQPGFDETTERTFSDETDAGRIPLAGDRQAAFPGEGPDFGFAHAADRKLAGGELCGVEGMQKIALVFLLIDTAQQLSGRADAREMPGCETFGAEPLRIGESDAEFDLSIAEHVRVGRAAGFQFGQKMREDAFAVFARETRLV
jgi:hypothetical protein